MSHDHDHGAHDPIQASEQVSEFEILERAVRELAIEKGLFSEEDHRRFSEWAESIGPSGGSKLVARAAIGHRGQRVSDAYDVLRETLGPDSRRESTLPVLERCPDPWESVMQATRECLSWRGTLDNLERRNAEGALDEATYRNFPVHARSVVVTAHER